MQNNIVRVRFQMASSTKVTAIQGIGIKYNQTRISIGQEYASQATRTRTYFHYPHCSIPLLVVDLLIQGTVTTFKYVEGGPDREALEVV